METTPDSVDEQERRIREEQGGAQPAETTPGDGTDEGDDVGHDDTPDDDEGGAGDASEGADTES